MNEQKDINDEGIGVGRLGIDWARQRAQINQRIDARNIRVRRIRLAWTTGAAIAAAALVILMWHRSFITPYSDEMDDFMAEIEAVSDDYVPSGLYVLNGFLDDKPDAETMVEFVIPPYGGEEDL